jgi:hypothetical protein
MDQFGQPKSIPFIEQEQQPACPKQAGPQEDQSGEEPRLKLNNRDRDERQQQRSQRQPAPRILQEEAAGVLSKVGLLPELPGLIVCAAAGT